MTTVNNKTALTTRQALGFIGAGVATLVGFVPLAIRATGGAIETLDSKINQAKKTTELKEIEAKNTLISNETITKEKLQQELIRKWDGKLPSTYICSEGNKNPMSLILKE